MWTLVWISVVLLTAGAGFLVSRSYKRERDDAIKLQRQIVLSVEDVMFKLSSNIYDELMLVGQGRLIVEQKNNGPWWKRNVEHREFSVVVRSKHDSPPILIINFEWHNSPNCPKFGMTIGGDPSVAGGSNNHDSFLAGNIFYIVDEAKKILRVSAV